MNKEWSELHKTMQAQIKKKDTFQEGIDTLFDLRNQLMQTIVSFKDELSREEFDAIPFINADGYHSKTIAYSLWHIFRIEDIVAHILVSETEQVFSAANYQERINPPVITTGNELVKREIADFSKQLNLEELYSYIFEVKESTEKILKSLSYGELKKKISEEKKEYLKSLQVVSTDEKAIWLIDYWCNKNVQGLIQMPFSRHWIMHVEACLRIKNKERIFLPMAKMI
ncbi:MAG: phage head-tail adapter protein [Lachnospiraceae bacterium]|nr:phage head-tail adapter protein [Lachnospiraceae bacterium]